MNSLAAVLDPYVSDWLHLLLRWLHVVAGIVWIGTSFYFVFLDNALLPPKQAEDARKGIGGELWAVHGGGFYHVQKYRVAPEALPDPLHWFKWEAYTTWLSGFALLIVLYYLDADVNLVDPTVADIDQNTAVGLSLILIAAAWLLYDGLCRALGSREVLLALSVTALVVAAAYGTSELFSARAAYLQVGSMIGTIMVGNVLFNIIPAQRELVAAKEAGRAPDPIPGLKARQRSVHNNYFTLPVVFTMISNHFPITFGHERAWLILVVLMLIGAWIRLFFNLRRQGRTIWAIPVTAALAVVALAVAIEPDEAPRAAGAGTVEFAKVATIVDERCAPCHSQQPSNDAYTTAPKGIAFDTPEQIAAQADAIEQQAVSTRAMPLGNTTGMTQEERDLLGAWIRQGAAIK